MIGDVAPSLHLCDFYFYTRQSIRSSLFKICRMLGSKTRNYTFSPSDLDG